MRFKILLVLASLLFYSAGAHAATYNFFFNNTEQGDNSSATPSMTVQDGKKVDNSGGLPKGLESSTNFEVNDSSSKFSKFRFSVSYAATRIDDNYYWNDSSKSTRGVLLAANYTLSREFGFSALMGKIWGPELEFYIVRHEPAGMNFSLLLGALLMDKRANTPNKFNPSFGVQAIYYLAKRVGMQAELRSNILNERNKGPTTSAGIAYLF